jgi:alcohol dehydrogenase class IV
MKRTVFGRNSIQRLAEIAALSKYNKIFLVTGKNSFTASGADKRLSPFFTGKDVCHFSDFSVNPKLESARNGADLLRQHQSEIIIAVGGGSVIDMAKLINSFAATKLSPEKLIKQQDAFSDKLLPLIAIPTTAGSGSESTHFAVVYYNGEKNSLANIKLKPDYVILDPDFLKSSSKNLISCSGFDAFSQAVESFWSVNSTSKSLKYALKAMKLIKLNISPAVKDDNFKAKSMLLLAAHLAGKAINISKTTAPHALSYTLTTEFNIPHGHAVALFLGKFLKYNFELNSTSKINDPRGVTHIENIKKELCEIFECKTPEQCMDNWYRLMRETGLTSSFKALGINSGELKYIVDHLNIGRMKNNPISFNKEELIKILKED